MNIDKNPIAYILCYTLRTTKNDKTKDHDYWLVFAEVDEDEREPLEQAQNMLNELQAAHENNEVTELYTWNIAKITKTNEWYATEKEVEFTPDAALSKWDDIEVQPVKDLGNGVAEVCDDDQADYYSVYLHQVEGGVQCVADLPTEELADQLASLLHAAADNYVDNGHLKKG